MSEGFGQTPNDLKLEILPQTQRTRIARHDEIELHGRKAAPRALTSEWRHMARATPRPLKSAPVTYPQLATCAPHLAGWHAGNRYQRPRRR